MQLVNLLFVPFPFLSCLFLSSVFLLSLHRFLLQNNCHSSPSILVSLISSTHSLSFPFPLCVWLSVSVSLRNPSLCLTFPLALHNNNNNTHVLYISHIVSDSALVSSVTIFATASQRPLCFHHIFVSPPSFCRSFLLLSLRLK